MIPREMDTNQLVDWIRDCIAMAEVASTQGDARLYSDAVEELRVLFEVYQQRVGERNAVR